MDWAAACVPVIYGWSGWPGPVPGGGCQGPALDNPVCCGVRGRGQVGGVGFYLPGGGGASRWLHYSTLIQLLYLVDLDLVDLAT